MRREQKRFFIHTAIAAAVLCAVIVGLPELAARHAGSLVGRAERDARTRLLHIRTLLTQDASDVESRFPEARADVAAAAAALDTARVTVQKSGALLGFAGRALPLRWHPPSIDAALAARVRNLEESLAWLSRALPALRKLAGYDAAADAAAAEDVRALSFRIYLARDGMQQAADAVAGTPAALGSEPVRDAVERTRKAVEAAEPLIRALENGGLGAAEPHLRLFIQRSDAAASAASAAIAILLARDTLESLAPEAHWISAQ